jgi:hypothetical protein
MASCYKVNIKLLGEIGYYILVEHVADTPFGFLELRYLHLGISPEEVTEDSLVRDVRWSLNHFDVPIIDQLLRETTMHTQDLIVDQRRHRQLFEYADEFLEEAAIFLVAALKGHFGFALPLKQSFVETIDVG